MCGIAGIVNRTGASGPPQRDELARMAGALQHRGPDEFGMYRDHRAGLSHARLSIIDLATGQQPLSNESGSLWIVFNGEIFNYVELRKELLHRGHQFHTHSDTEVIVHAYEEWSERAFERLNGQWAVALWDATAGRLVLARDPYGVRPLYLTEHEGRLYFASEVKALFAANRSITRRLDPVGLDEVFTFWTPVAPRTVFEGVEELEPGSVRTYSPEGITERRCWRPSYPASLEDGFRGTVADAAEAVRDALERATELRMLRADVPVGSYLSGGLDSSLVAALALRAKGARFSTYSLRFADAEYDETHYQRAMSRYIGSEHHEIVVTRSDIARVFPTVIAHTERPVLRTAPAPMYLLSELVHRSGIKVVLTGEGADEMFAGYDLFREAKVRRFWAKQPESLARPRLLDKLYPYLARSPVAQRAMARRFFGQHLHRAAEPGFGHDIRWRGTSSAKRLFSDDFRSRLGATDSVTALLDRVPDEFLRWSSLAQDQYLEIRILLSGYLLSSQGDRMLMANSVEGRFPFLDRDVAALADSLPPSFKLHGLDEKHVLKRAARGLVPDLILERKKQPYRAPDALSFAEEDAGEWIEAVASDSRIAEAGVFNASAARGLINKCRSQAAIGQLSNSDNIALVGLLSTQLLHHTFIAACPMARSADVRTDVDRVEALGAGGH